MANGLLLRVFSAKPDFRLALAGIHDFENEMARRMVPARAIHGFEF